MSKWNKEELENMLEDVVNELDLSEAMIEEHGQHGTSPAELVRLVLEQKDKQIAMINIPTPPPPPNGGTICDRTTKCKRYNKLPMSFRLC